MLNISFKSHGALRFLKVGRLTLSWSISREYRPFKHWSADYIDQLCLSAVERALA